MARFVFLMSFNLLGNLMVCKDLVDLNSEDGSEFFRAMNGLNFDGVEWACQRGGFVCSCGWVGSGRPSGTYKREMGRDMGKAI